jgi:exosortase
MKNTEAIISSAHPVEFLSKTRVRGIVFIVMTALLMVLFWSPLVQLLQHVSKAELNSYIPLLPLVSVYLLWSQRAQLSSLWDYRVPIAALFGGIGLAVILFYQTDISRDLVRNDGNLLSLQILAFISLVAGLLLFLLGKANFTHAAFPVGFLFLAVPLPETAVRWLTLFLQHASADAAYGLFMVTGTPVFRDGLAFALPGLKVIVAEECSGLRSAGRRGFDSARCNDRAGAWRGARKDQGHPHRRR